MNEKDCTPKNCPHAKLLTEAREACASCTSPTCTPGTCQNAALLERARAACIKCTRGGKPSGRGGQVSIEAAGEAVIERSAAYIDRSPRGQVTKLGQRTEDMAAELFRRWQGLDTIDSLLALHLANGGTCANFGAYLERTHAAIDKLRPERKTFRATAWSKWQGILKRLPLLRGVQSWSKGHGGAKPGQGKGVHHHFKNPDMEAKRIERLRIAAAKEVERKRSKDKMQQLIAQLDTPGPTGFRWLAAMVQNNELPLIVAARRLRIGSRKFLRIAELLGIWMPHPIIERRRLKAAQAASGVQPSAPAGPTTAPAQPTAAATLSAHGAP